jgi:hypothetical protein
VVRTVPAKEPRPTPAPLEVPAVWVVGGGTAVWFVIFLVLLPMRGRLADDGHELWFWTSLAGWLLGLLGTWLSWRQNRPRS